MKSVTAVRCVKSAIWREGLPGRIDEKTPDKRPLARPCRPFTQCGAFAKYASCILSCASSSRGRIYVS